MPGTNYPTSLDDSTSLRTVTDAVDDILAIDQNYKRDALIAIEGKLGVSSSTPTIGKFLVGDTVAGTSIWRVIASTDIPTLNQNTSGSSGSCTGNAATATKLAATKMINGSAFDGSADIANNFPEGFLINGKIVPSVANNDLTLAIKGMDGNDPSATNPVYCRIGDTTRSITSALSKTLADGTNWFNAGRAELATKSIDYFVYLGYNATDGVVIGFARRADGTAYSSFSTTTTSENYCAISTISNAAAGDNYVNIGRFAATLSAGAGYTWTVPTFDHTNLIQRPIYETRRLDFVSTIVGFSGTPTQGCKYQIIGKNIHLFINITGTSNATGFTFTLPFAPSVSGGGYTYGLGNDNGSLSIRTLEIGSTCTIWSSSTSLAAWTASGTKSINGVNFFTPWVGE